MRQVLSNFRYGRFWIWVSNICWRLGIFWKLVRLKYSLRRLYRMRRRGGIVLIGMIRKGWIIHSIISRRLKLGMNINVDFASKQPNRLKILFSPSVSVLVQSNIYISSAWKTGSPTTSNMKNHKTSSSTPTTTTSASSANIPSKTSLPTTIENILCFSFKK